VPGRTGLCLPVHLVREPLAGVVPALPIVAIKVDRQRLARRLWRATADDGADFGFEVGTPLRHGDAVHVSEAARYVIEQQPEPVLEIPLDVAPDAAAVIGWAVGNMHFVIEAQPDRLLAPDDPALRQSLDRLGIHYHEATGIFQPHRFSGSLAGHGHHHHRHDDHHHDDHGHAGSPGYVFKPRAS
jgi:urease accessory protein